MEEFYVFDKTNEEIKVNVYLKQLKVDSTNNDLHYTSNNSNTYEIKNYSLTSNTIDYISNNEISEE